MSLHLHASPGLQLEVGPMPFSSGQTNKQGAEMIKAEAIIHSARPRQLQRGGLADASRANLDTAIHLFREVLIRRPFPDPQRLKALKDLANALLMRFECTEWLDDLDEGLRLHNEAGLWMDDPTCLRETTDPCRADSDVGVRSIIDAVHFN